MTRLGPAIEHALEQTRLRLERERFSGGVAGKRCPGFRQVVENIGEVFWMKDVASQRVIYVSPTYDRIWQRSRDDLLAAPNAWLESVHPDDRPRVLAALPNQVLGDFDIQYRILRPNGGIRHIRDRAFPVRNAAGEVFRLAGLAEDITERKSSEERQQQQSAMLEMARDAIIVRDFHTEQIMFWNKGAERTYGWTAEEALERPIGDLLCLDPGLPAQISAGLGERDEWSGETKHITKAGKKIIVSVRATLIRDADGKPQAVLSISHRCDRTAKIGGPVSPRPAHGEHRHARQRRRPRSQ